MYKRKAGVYEAVSLPINTCRIYLLPTLFNCTLKQSYKVKRIIYYICRNHLAYI